MSDSTMRPPEDAEPDTDAQMEAPERTPGDVIEALARESAEYKDKLLRSLAEMENLRRRTERDVADARNYGIASFARDVLGIADNMRRALDAGGSELRAAGDAHAIALLDGVELTERELLKVMEKNGVRKFDPQGQKFDPNVHQAMYEAPDPSVPAGTIVQVIQPGFMMGERVLRPALVVVAKGGQKPQAAEPQQDRDDAERG